MRKLSYVVVSVLAIASEATMGLIPLTTRAQAMIRPDAKVPYILHCVTYPKNPQFKNATYHFGLQVTGMAVSRLTVDIPDGIRVTKDIKVSDQEKRKVAAEVSINDGNVTISFAQPVPTNTKLEVDLKGVDASFYIPSTKLFQVSGTVPGLTHEIPFGTARFQTHR